MNGIEFIEETTRAKEILLREGLLDALGNEPVKAGPRMRACLHRSPQRHILGIRFTGCRKEHDNGFSVLLGDRGMVTPERWAVVVATILEQLGKASTCEAQILDMTTGTN